MPSDSITIVAPISGYITRKWVVEGDFVMPQKPLYEISDLSTVWVIGKVFEGDIPKVKKGMRVLFKPDAALGRIFSGEIEYIYPEFEMDTRTARVRVTVKNEGGVLKPGMYGKIEISGEKSSVVAVSREAVIDSGVEKYLFVSLGEGHFEPRVVKTGVRFGDYVEVHSGVKEGEVVVVSSHFLIDSESKLKASRRGFGGAGSEPPAEHRH